MSTPASRFLPTAAGLRLVLPGALLAASASAHAHGGAEAGPILIAVLSASLSTLLSLLVLAFKPGGFKQRLIAALLSWVLCFLFVAAIWLALFLRQGG